MFKIEKTLSTIVAAFVAGVLLTAILIPRVMAFASSSDTSVQKADYGENGYHLSECNPYSGKLIIGDSRVCQMWDSGTKASYVSVWGGHYYGTKGSINSDEGIRIMKKYIKKTLDKKGYCDVYIFASVNDFNGGSETEAKLSADKLLKLAKMLNVSDNVNINIVGLVGTKGVDVTGYNQILQDNIAQGMKFASIEGCLKGENNGYLSDNIHFNKVTLKKIAKKIL